MLPILDVYTRYQVPSHLARHMLQCAAVADWLLSVWSGEEIDQQVVIETLLVHDLANILKFDWSLPQEYFGWGQEDATFYQSIAKKIAQRYGDDEVVATKLMIQELSLDDKVALTFTRIGERHEKPWLDHEREVQLVWYCDMRVGPQGLVSIEERFADGLKRYQHRPEFNFDRYQADLLRCREIEQRIGKSITTPLAQLTPNNLDLHYSKVQMYQLPSSVALHRLPQL